MLDSDFERIRELQAAYRIGLDNPSLYYWEGWLDALRGADCSYIAKGYIMGYNDAKGIEIEPDES